MAKLSKDDTQAAPILVERRNGFAKITLNRPDTRNAFSSRTHEWLMQGLKDAEDDTACHAVLLTNAGPVFCSGQDLNERDPRKVPFQYELSETVERYYNTLIRRLRTLDIPVICAVNGVAAGAGIGIALACDITIAATDADFVFAFSRIGLIPDSGTTWMLTRRLGEARAMALTLTGARISGAQAAEMGLIWRAVPQADLIAETEALAVRLAEGPAEALRLTRLAIRAAGEASFNDQLDLERDLQGRAGRNPDYAEGVLAFLEKRRAVFGNNPGSKQDN